MRCPLYTSKEYILQIICSVIPQQVMDSAGFDECTLLNDADPVAEVLHFSEHMAGDQRGNVVLPGQPLDQFLHLPQPERVYAMGGLIQNNQGRTA